MKRNLAIGAALGGAVVLGALIAAFGNAQPDKLERSEAPSRGLFTSEQEEEIGRLVRDYLLENPEIIFKAAQAYQIQQQELADVRAMDGARSNLAALIDDKHGYSVGAAPDKARVAVIELFDYHCGHCKRAAGLVQDLTKKDPAVKVVFREFPIFGETSDLAARAALAAREQGKYAAMHFDFMSAPGQLEAARIKDIAKKNGVDYAMLEKAMNDPSVDAALEDTDRIAREMGIDGTPAFIIASIDGDYLEVIPGFNGPAIVEAIEEAKKAKK